ncbi:hypothetical protein V500_05085 [Pseudogymnoascus sp. VKM F-4518 (FW-2643)]|nr:hypothetical protein V500_05085 [Pseudogymnoascus sp. VKM F-4518 (FW-2643)]
MILPYFLLLGIAPAYSLGAVLYATHYTGTLSVLSLTTQGSTSRLSVVSSKKTCGSQPSWLTLDSANRVLYCLDEADDGATLNAYAASPSGALTQSAQIRIAGGAVHSTLYGGPDGRSFQAVAHYGSSQLSTFALPINSKSKSLQSFKYTLTAPGPNENQDVPHPHQAVLDPTGSFIVVPDLGADILRIYSVNKKTGFLTSCNNVTVLAGSGPRHAGFWNPTARTDRTKLFIGNELSKSASAFSVSYPQKEGGCLALELVQTSNPYPPSPPAKAGQDVEAVMVKGNTLTISNPADNRFGSNNDSVAVFSISSSGTMTLQDMSPTYGSYPRTLQINKAGDLVAIGNQNSGTVVIVARNPTSGKLGKEVARVKVGPQATNGDGGLSSVIWDE